VAHELNNPLTGVRGFAEILQQSRLDAHQHRMVERIEKEADRAARVVRNLLTFSRRHKPEKGLHDLNGILNTVLEMRSYECRVSNVELAADLDPELPRTMVDAHQLHQVFLNLLTNAEHAVSENGRPGRIVLRSRAEGDRIRVQVVDNGPGIDPESVGRIFNPFFTTKEVGHGTGLGLSICYGIVQEHGGTIEVEGRPGEGACFSVILPVLQPAAGAPTREAPEGEAHLEARPGERILVVDDELSVREIVRESLEARGFRVEAAVGGAEALTRLQGASYDLVLTDLRMPGIGGRELYERVLRSDPDQAGRFVFFTGDVARADTGRFLAETGRPVLAKPFGIDELLRAVAEGLSRRAPEDSTNAALERS
jgi:two-component system NtrC family sensor kinase